MATLNLTGLTSSEARWIDYVKNAVVGRLAGSREERARTAGIVTWWALKEGILDTPNPLRHSLCSQAGADRPIGDLEVCTGPIWQVGLAGIQPSSVSLAQAEDVAARLYPGESIPSVLRRTAENAGVDAATVQQIEQIGGTLRKSWLLRDPAIAFELQRPFVETQCLNGAASWCYGSWETARRFASDRSRIAQVTSELASFFQDAPTPRSGLSFARALVLSVGAGAAYWWFTEGPGSTWITPTKTRSGRVAA